MSRRIVKRTPGAMGPELVSDLGRGGAFSVWLERDGKARPPPRPRPGAAAPQPQGGGRLVAGRYQLGERLGCGSMGEVWAGYDRRDQRPVAVKLLLPELVGTSSEPHVRFMREAMVLTKIRSPHVVEVYDYGEDKSTHFIVMELLTGIDLQRLLSQQGRLEAPALCVLTSDVAQALHAIHAVGVVHRDLKPSNIIICQVDGDRVAKVIDEIRPMLQADGGDIELVAVDKDGTVKVRLKGACHGCPHAAMTIKNGVEARLKEAVPEIAGVVAVND